MDTKSTTQRVELTDCNPRVCQLHFNSIHEKLDTLLEKQGEMHREIFVTNGHPCLLERVRGLEKWKKTWVAVGVAALTCVGAIVGPKLWHALVGVVADQPAIAQQTNAPARATATNAP